MRNRYNVYPLWILAQVHRLGSISRAADELEITQPAVSAQLKLLELSHGKLYNRAPKGVILTAQGLLLLECSRRIFDELDKLDELCLGGNGSLKGRIRLGASSLPGAYLLPSLLASFKQRFPDVEVEMKISSSLVTLQSLLDDTFSFAVVGELYGRVSQGPLEWKNWREDRLEMFASPDSILLDGSIPWEERLKTTYLLLREKGSSTRSVAEELLRRWLGHFRAVLEIGSSEAVRESVVANLGVAVLSGLAVQREVKAGLLVPVPLEQGSRVRPFFLVRHRDRCLSQVETALWDDLLSINISNP